MASPQDPPPAPANGWLRGFAGIPRLEYPASLGDEHFRTVSPAAMLDLVRGR